MRTKPLRYIRKIVPVPFIPNTYHWGPRPFTYARECARRIRQRTQGKR